MLLCYKYNICNYLYKLKIHRNKIYISFILLINISVSPVKKKMKTFKYLSHLLLVINCITLRIVLWGHGLPDPVSPTEPAQVLLNRNLKGEQPNDIESNWSKMTLLKSNISL